VTNSIVPYDQMERMAHSLVKSRMFGLENVDQAMSLMAIAQSEGRHPATIARDFHIIEGKPAKKPEAMLRDFVAGGGRVEWHALDDTVADATFSHPAGGTVRITWDMPRAMNAGLLGRKGDMYKKYPRAMLRSRTVSEGIRSVGPFATSGVYTPDEVRDMAVEATMSNDLDPQPEIKDVSPGRPGQPRKLAEGVVADHLAAIDAAADLEALKRAFQAAYTAAKQVGDFSAVETFERKKDARKRDLTAEDAS
jgi:hypothetical protein